MKYDIWAFFRKSDKDRFSWNMIFEHFFENLTRTDFHEIWYLSIFFRKSDKDGFSWNLISEHFFENLTRTYFYEIWYLSIFFRKSDEKIQILLKSDKKKGYFTWRQIYIFFIASRSVLLRIRNVSEKKSQRKTKHILISMPFLKNRAVYEKMWKNIVDPDRPQTTVWRMRIACWITKATNTYSE